MHNKNSRVSVNIMATGIKNQICLESDFVRGRVFGIKGNIRKGVVVKKEAMLVTWRWVSSEPGEGTIDTISDLMYWIVWLGGIELEHLTEADDIEPLHA